MAETTTEPMTDLDRLWHVMNAAIERYEHASMVARESDDPFWEEMARLSGITAERAIKAYEESANANNGGCSDSRGTGESDD